MVMSFAGVCCLTKQAVDEGSGCRIPAKILHFEKSQFALLVPFSFALRNHYIRGHWLMHLSRTGRKRPTAMS